MSDEENTGVEQEAQTAVTEAPESENAQPQAQEPKETQRKRNDVEYNWAEARKKMEALDRQNREMAMQLEKLQKPQPRQEPEVDELDKLADDDIITKAHAKKMAEKMARQIANEVIKQRENATVDDRLQLKFPDFADVVTKDAIEELKQTEPELAFSLANNPDPYAQGVAAYKLLKRIGRGVDPVMAQEKKKAQENSQKPVSVNAVTKNSAIGNAHLFENGLTPELKKSLWKEMEEARKKM
jgi:hypothetical protein